MTDNDLEFLKQSIASLNDSCHELHAAAVAYGERMKRIEEREKEHRHAVLRAIQAYLEAFGAEG